MRKEDYGRPPAYLALLKEEVRREKELVAAYVQARLGHTGQSDPQNEPACGAELAEAERVALVAALKRRWARVNAEYQKGTHLVQLDTLGKVLFTHLRLY